MINRYQGNTGRVVRVEDNAPSGNLPAPAVRPAPPAKKQPGLMASLSNLLPQTLGELESEDLILLLILYLMYKESGDSELLIIMGAMFLL